MARLAVIFLFVAACTGIGSAQQQATLNDVRKAYEAFDYAGVVRLSDQLLAGSDTLSKQSRIAILTFKGVSRFILGEADSARETFIALVKLDRSFTPDPVLFSPKIVEFFDQVKKGIPPEKEQPLITAANPDSSEQQRNSESLVPGPALDGAVIARSLVLPGWGHLSIRPSTRGWLLATAGAAVLAASIYYIVRTNRKENDYLNETDRQAIADNYDAYNSTYKTRNILLASYGVIWTAAQIDLLFFTRNGTSGFLTIGGTSRTVPDFSPHSSFRVNVSL